MKKKEYLQLIENSRAFKALDKDLQQKLLNAKGAEMEKFGAILKDEQYLMYSAKKELVERNEQALKDMGTKMRQFKKNYLKMTESAERKKEEQTAENLLQSL